MVDNTMIIEKCFYVGFQLDDGKSLAFTRDDMRCAFLDNLQLSISKHVDEVCVNFISDWRSLFKTRICWLTDSGLVYIYLSRYVFLFNLEKCLSFLV
jgi:hypothetical protein